ncbi:kinase-like domain-containing protein [Dunaliella salina]|uniref:Kinase-like domain-containing protein n=1 Tax=Dunaliella salina TaxID=3046 RepID=A0ABQ7GNL1_DUNSA|nr:kinase-like domain-containing protein [Dunaliella salina]|eukprot:KAF5836199.1 kinase-like domain-containing protein [Dunaliella salina]
MLSREHIAGQGTLNHRGGGLLVGPHHRHLSSNLHTNRQGARSRQLLQLLTKRREFTSPSQTWSLQALPAAAYKAPKRVCRPGIPPATSTLSFQVPDRPSPPLRADDKEGHYVYQLGENLSSRYKILSKMGEGTFGRVLECWDRKHKDYVAIKIVRNIDKYRHAAMIELEVLNTLERNDPEGNKNCVALREWFDYRGHVCMVFEKLGPSLFDFMRKNEYRPFPIDLVQEFSKQLIQAVAYLHDLHLVHTDLKPENILLMSLNYCRSSSGSGQSSTSRVVPSSSAIKVIDFGSSTFEEQYHSSIVSTRHYRAPEIIMGMGWSYPCDMWSLGCIIVELLTGAGNEKVALARRCPQQEECQGGEEDVQPAPLNP